jgi:DNA replicative helicase MCM subunit Mcm2 (Cdc46/Mcm family)
VVLLRARVRLAEARARRDLSDPVIAQELATEADRLFRQIGDQDGMREAAQLLGELGAGG